MKKHLNKTNGKPDMPRPTAEAREWYRKAVPDMTIMDDAMAAVVLQNKKCVERIINVILGRNDLKVVSVQVQKIMHNLRGRSIRLDCYVVDLLNRRYNIEIQKELYGAPVERARFHTVLMDSNVLKKSADFKKLPESYVIFIVDGDPFGDGLPLYTIDRVVKETGKPFNDKMHIVYVNALVADDTPLGLLMRDFHQKDPDKFFYPELKQEVYSIKCTEEGELKMDKWLNFYAKKLYERKRHEEKLATASYFIKKGIKFDDIANGLQLSLEEVEQIASQQRQRQ